MGKNLLLNPSFEEGYCRDTQYWDANGGPYHTEFGEIYTPKYWTSWWVEGVQNYGSPDDQLTGRPHVELAPKSLDPTRVYDGEWALKMFTFWRTCKMGVLQRVFVTPGSRLRLSAYAHAWYSDCDNRPHDIPYKQDCSTPAVDSHMYLRVGISLTGNSDPLWTGDAKFSPNMEIYGKYAAQLVLDDPELVAQGDSVVFFLRANCNYALKHCDTYWDYVSLEVVESPEPCKGLPRVQYRRVFNVIPPDASDEQAAAIFREGWERGHESAGGSFDDAGVGDLDDKVANLYGIQPDHQAEYIAFYDGYYPGTEVAFKPIPDILPPVPEELVLAYPTTYMPPTITQEFKPGHTAIDLRSSWKYYGSEIIAAFPGIVIEAGWNYNKFGYCVLTRTKMEDGRTVDIRYAHMLEDLYVQVGESVAIGSKLGKADGSADPIVPDHLHFSVCIDGTYVDPEPLIDWPDYPGYEGPPGIDIGGETPSLHLQTFPTSAETYIASTHPRIVKGLAGQQDWWGVMRNDPAARFLWRHHGDQSESLGQSTPKLAAAKWISYWISSLHTECDRIEEQFPNIAWPYMIVESWNEVYASFDPKMPWIIDAEVEFLKQLHDAEPRVAGCVFNAPVGNPHESEFHLLNTLAQAAAEFLAWFGYHAYWHGNKNEYGMTDIHWPYLAGRWTEIDKVLDYKVRWSLGESGIVGGHSVATIDGFASLSAEDSSPWSQNRFTDEKDMHGNYISADPWKHGSNAIVLPPHSDMLAESSSGGGYWLNPGSGWLDAVDCIGGDQIRYVSEIMEMRHRIAIWNASHDNRCDEFALFTTGIPSYMGWGNFQIQGPQMLAITAAIKLEV